MEFYVNITIPVTDRRTLGTSFYTRRLEHWGSCGGWTVYNERIYQHEVEEYKRIGFYFPPFNGVFGEDQLVINDNTGDVYKINFEKIEETN